MLGAGALLLRAGRRPAPPVPWAEAVPRDGTWPPVEGHLILSTFGRGSHSSSPDRHSTTLIRGVGYEAVEDNDIRGYLDGTFKWGWNQTSQGHVRVGRRPRSPRYGELEVFRVLYRWDSLPLPRDARVHEAELRLSIEEGVDRPQHLALYAVKRDWNPGAGGVLGNNVSPPRPGEVWWNDRSFGQVPWGLPGVGFASDDADDADTPAMPLAMTRYAPGDSTIAFASDRLAHYLGDRIRAGAPALFLLKLTDADEDLPATMMLIFSANHGDSHNPARRPRLTLTWDSPSQQTTEDVPLLLEYGRTLGIARTTPPGARTVNIAFVPRPGGATPWIELREGTGSDTTAWRRATVPTTVTGGWFEVRVTATHEPLSDGQPFVARLRDTWIRTAAPETQRVPWVFHAASGVVDTVLATYVGDYTWEVTYTPAEPGPWSYQWFQTFTTTPVASEVGHFDVVLRSRADAHRALTRFVAELAGARDLPPAALRRRYVQFARLERAVMLLETPRSFRSDHGRELRTLLRTARSRLAGVPVPDSIPMVPSPPARWERDSVSR